MFVAVSGVILACMAFLPKVGAAVGAIQPFMLGGALVFMFGMIVVVGIKIVFAIAGRAARLADSRGFGRPQHGGEPGADKGVRDLSGGDPHSGRGWHRRRYLRSRAAEFDATVR